MNEPKCHVCGDDSLETLFEVFEDQRLVRCNACRIVAIEPFKDVNYDEDFSGATAKSLKIPGFITRHIGTDGRSPSSDHRNLTQLNEIEKVRKALNSGAVSASGQVDFLDYGCGDGDFMLSAKESGYGAWGVEISQAKIAACQAQQLTVLHTDKREELPKEFQVIRLSHVLEHVQDPRELLEFCRDRMATCALLVIEVPNFSSPLSTMRRGGWRFIRKDHLYYFTPDTLTTMLQSVGLTVLKGRVTGSLGLTQILNERIAPWSGAFIRHHPWTIPAKKVYSGLMSTLRLGDFVRVFATLTFTGVRPRYGSKNSD